METQNLFPTMKNKIVRWSPLHSPLLSPGLLALAAMFVFGAAETSSVAATVRTWTGASGSSGNWTTPGNWSGNVAPVAGDILNFVDTGSRKASNTNNFAAGTAFSTINVFGTGYRLRGNSVSISNYVGQGAPTGTNIIDLDIRAAGPGVGLTLRSSASPDRLTLNGDINLNGHELATEGPGDFIVAGVISGTGDIYKANGGDLTLAGLGANTFSGTTRVVAGILRLGRYTLGGGLTFIGTTAIPGDLVIGDVSSALIGDVVALQRDNQIADTSVVWINSTGSFELGDFNDTVGSLRLRGGTITSGDGVLSVDGVIKADSPLSVNKDSLIAGHLNLGGRGAGPQLVDVAQGVQLNISAQISGATTSDLIKTNRGELWLSSSNIFNGDVLIEDGVVGITQGWALGSTAGVTKPILGKLILAATMGIQESLEVPGPFGTVAVTTGNPSWLGNVLLNDDVIFDVVANSTLSVIGAISGPAGWMKTGDGTLQFKTPYTNTYGGNSWVREGNLIMDGVMNQPVIPGPLIIGNATDPTNSTRVWPIKQNQIADTAPVTLNHSGVLELGGFSDTVGALTFNGGAVETSTGILTLNGDILVHATNETARLLGKLSLGGATRTIYTVGYSNTPDLLISAVISDGSGAAGINKVGEGSLRLNNANTFTGPVSVLDGRLHIAHPQALGSVVAGTSVSGIDGGRLVLEANAGMVVLEPLTLDSTAPGAVVVENFSGHNEWNGPITLLAPESVISVPSLPRPLGFGGLVSGPGGLRKVGAGLLRLEGSPANTYAGLTVVAEGVLILDKPSGPAVPGNLLVGDGVGGVDADRVLVLNGGDEIANTSRVTIQSSGQLELAGVPDLVGSLEGSGHVLLTGASSALGVGRNGLSTVFDGVISGQGNFEKLGGGALTLNGTQLFTGDSGVAEGTLVVNGSLATSARIQVNRPLIPANNPPGLLAGNGTVPRIIPFAGGKVAPGQSPGRLIVQGDADLTGIDVLMELNGPSPATQYDQLRATGGVTLNNTRLILSVGFAPTTNDTFVIVDKISAGPVNGFFQNALEGSIVTTGPYSLRISYQGGDGNDVVLRRVGSAGSMLTGIAPATPETMRITGQGDPFVTFILEVTPHLNAPIPWTPIATNQANAQGLYEFIDPYSSGGTNLFPMRFYRARAQ